MNKEVFSICVAYEQGVGKGRSGRCAKKDNPYCAGTDEHEAWNYGWQEGDNWLTQRIKKETERIETNYENQCP